DAVLRASLLVRRSACVARNLLCVFLLAATFRCSQAEKTSLRPLNPASSGTSAATPRKFYHMAFAESAYPATPEHRGPSSSESAPRTPASPPAPLVAPETPQRRSPRPQSPRQPAPPQSDRSAPQMAACPQSRTKAGPPARPRLARSSPSQTAPRRPYF